MARETKAYYESLPKKRIGVGALTFHKGQLLIVQPCGSAAWILPGGTVEHEESPLEALHREVYAELSLMLQATNLIAVDYVANTDSKGEYLQMIFATKDLSNEQVTTIKPRLYDIEKYKLADIDEALNLLAPVISKRVRTLLKNLDSNEVHYLENGRETNKPVQGTMTRLCL